MKLHFNGGPSWTLGVHAQLAAVALLWCLRFVKLQTQSKVKARQLLSHKPHFDFIYMLVSCPPGEGAVSTSADRFYAPVF